jgi:hypothetical protein
MFDLTSQPSIQIEVMFNANYLDTKRTQKMEKKFQVVKQFCLHLW